MKPPVTPALRFLREAKIDFLPHLYDYEDRGGTKKSSAALGVPEHQVIKTLVLEDESRLPLIALMHGDCEVSTKGLARHLQKKSIVPCRPEIANRHSGYLVGGTSPFGTRRKMPIYAQMTIQELPRIYINGGKRGFLVQVEPCAALNALGVEWVEMRA